MKWMKSFFYGTSVFLMMVAFAYAADSPSSYKKLAQDYAGPVGKGANQTHTFTVNLKSPGSSFRVYVPPGTTSVTLTIFTPSEAKIGGVARLGQPPQCSYTSNKCYTELNWDGNTGTSLSTLRSRDWRAKNTGGRIVLVNDNLSSATTTGEWLYVKALSYGSGNFAGVVYTPRVNVGKYLAWYGTGNPMPGQPDITSTGMGSCDFEINADPPCDADDPCKDPNSLECICSKNPADERCPCDCTCPAPNPFAPSECVLPACCNDDPCDIDPNSDACFCSKPENAKNSRCVDDPCEADPGSVACYCANHPENPKCTTCVPTIFTPCPAAPTSPCDIDSESAECKCDKNPSSCDPDPDPVIVPQMTLVPGVFTDKKIVRADVGSRTKIVIKPKYIFPALAPGVYDLYAMIIEGREPPIDAWLAQKDRMGKIVFTQYMLGDYLKSLAQVDLTSETMDSDIFKSLLTELNLNMDYMIQNQLHFFFAIAPAGTLDANMRGAHIWFEEQ